MSEEREKFKPDLSLIEFPTDQITLKQMRDCEHVMQSPLAMSQNRVNAIEAISTMLIEQRLALQAWGKAIGRTDIGLVHIRKEDEEHLNEIYEMYGISSGMNQTLELIRRFESESARLGRLSLGEGR